MKAIMQYKYGSPDVLELREVDSPVVKDDQVLVRVQAAGVHIGDWLLMSGLPYLVRLVSGLIRPKNHVPGSDVAGRVETVGKNVSQFHPGDEVFGWGNGAFAEYVSVSEDALVPKPANLTFEQAAAVPVSAFTALHALRDKGEVEPGQKVLIIGAGGGAGTFAVQMAKSFGADVTGVDSTEKLEMMSSIGADRVIDYTREDFAEDGARYDLILDLVGHRSIFDFRRALSRNGSYVMVGGSTARIVQAVIVGRWFSMTGSQAMGLLVVKPNKKDLASVIELVEAGEVVPVIDRQYPLDEVPDALRYLGEGHARGKVVIAI